MTLAGLDLAGSAFLPARRCTHDLTPRPRARGPTRAAGAPGDRCVACPLAHRCSCGAGIGQPCTRPSGHRGPLIGPHVERLLHSDVDAIVRDAASVESRLLADRDNPDHRREWARALHSLQRHPHIWQGRVDAALIDRLVALAGGRADPAEQLTLL